MSFLPVLEYGVGLAAFGLAYWMMDYFKDEIQGISETGLTYDLLQYFWIAIVIIYVLFGGIWLVRKFNELQYQRGG